MFASLACQEAHSWPPRSRTMIRAFGVAGLLAVALLAMSVMSGVADARTTVLMVHGGGWTGGSPSTADPMVENLRAHGIATKQVTYVVDSSGFIPAELARVRRAVRSEKQLGNRVVLYGISAGAQLSLALAAKGEVDGAVAIAAPTDLQSLKLLVPAAFGMTDLQMYQMSPLRRLTKRAAPTLLLHGDADTYVPIEQSTSYLSAARHYQRDVSLVTMPGVNHEIPPSIYQDRASRWVKKRTPSRKEARALARRHARH